MADLLSALDIRPAQIINNDAAQALSLHCQDLCKFDVSNKFERTSYLSSIPVQRRATDELQWAIDDHNAYHQRQSYLGRAIGLFYRKDDQSLLRLEILQRNANSNTYTDIKAAIALDRAAMKGQDAVHGYVGGFLKALGTFTRGPIGYGAVVLASALDEASPNDSVGTQLGDLTLGGLKGGLTKASFSWLNGAEFSPAAQAVGLGISSRLINETFSRRTWTSDVGEKLSAASGVMNIFSNALNPTALAADVAIYGASRALLGGINLCAMDVLRRNPLLGTVATGATFGVSAGGIGELMRQHREHEQYDFVAAAKKALIQGTLDAAASVPGGLQAQTEFKVRREKGEISREGSTYKEDRKFFDKHLKGEINKYVRRDIIELNNTVRQRTFEGQAEQITDTADVPTSTGIHRADPGDWLITAKNGETRLVSDETMRTDYEPTGHTGQVKLKADPYLAVAEPKSDIVYVQRHSDMQVRKMSPEQFDLEYEHVMTEPGLARIMKRASDMNMIEGPNKLRAKSVEYVEEMLGKDSPAVTHQLFWVLSNVGESDPALAARLAQKDVDLSQRLYGPRSQETGRALYDLQNALKAAGRPSEARQAAVQESNINYLNHQEWLRQQKEAEMRLRAYEGEYR